MPITFRAIGPHDLTKLAAWRNENLRFYKDQRPVTLEGTRRWFAALGPTQRYFIARLADEEIGVARMHDVDAGARSTGIGGDIVKELRGRGLGRRMFSALIARCREEGLDRIWLEVLEDNAVAAALYRSLGFCEVARHGNAIRMELRP